MKLQVSDIMFHDIINHNTHTLCWCKDKLSLWLQQLINKLRAQSSSQLLHSSSSLSICPSPPPPPTNTTLQNSTNVHHIWLLIYKSNIKIMKQVLNRQQPEFFRRRREETKTFWFTDLWATRNKASLVTKLLFFSLSATLTFREEKQTKFMFSHMETQKHGDGFRVKPVSVIFTWKGFLSLTVHHIKPSPAANWLKLLVLFICLSFKFICWMFCL